MSDKQTSGFIARVAELGGARLILELMLVAGIFVLGYSLLQSRNANIRAEIEAKPAQSRIAARDAQAQQKVKQYQSLKKTKKTSQQIAQAFPEVADLPTPPSVFPPAPTTGPQSSKQAGGGEPKAGGTARPTSPGELPEAPTPQNWHDILPYTPSLPESLNSEKLGVTTSGLYFPPQDIKPLFDRLADCKAMEAHLGTCQANFKDMTAERDAYKKAARGGGFWVRLKSNTKMLLIGAGGGLVITCATGHCR